MKTITKTQDLQEAMDNIRLFKEARIPAHQLQNFKKLLNTKYTRFKIETTVSGPDLIITPKHLIF